MATTQLMMNDNDEALETLDSLIFYVPKYGMAYVQKGWIYESIDKYELAIENLEKYLDVVSSQYQSNRSRTFVKGIKKTIRELKRELK